MLLAKEDEVHIASERQLFVEGKAPWRTIFLVMFILHKISESICKIALEWTIKFALEITVRIALESTLCVELEKTLKIVLENTLRIAFA